MIKAPSTSFSDIRRACFRRKSVAQAIASSTQPTQEDRVGLSRTLTALDLVLYGVGSSVGAGIYVLVGLGAKIAGPAIGVSFLGCGCACILTSFCYAEFASRIPVTGSAFIYAYIAFGELFAWLVGWNLTLGYGFTAAVCAKAWGDYLGNFILQSVRAAGAGPTWQIAVQYMTEFPLFGTRVNYTCSLLSIVVIYGSTLCLLRGAKDSSRFNNAMTLLNISILALVIITGLASDSVQAENWIPFAPQGLSGIVAGAGLVFFAFIGFDMVASLSEEVVHPEKNMPIGIVGSLVISTLLYVTVALVVVGMAPIPVLGETVPIVNALQSNACCTHDGLQQSTAQQVCLYSDCSPQIRPWLAKIARLVSAGAILGLIASVFTSLMGQPRILFSLSRDGLIHPSFASVDPVTQVPRTGIIVTGVVTAFLACFAPMGALANLISLGTLMVFSFVDVGVLFLRLREMTRKSSDNPLHRDLEYQHTISGLVILFTLSTLACSILLSHTTLKVAAYIIGFLSLLMAGLITIIPPTWAPDSQFDTDSARSHEHHYFQSPFVPILPLLGISCNTFMMGSLPLSSWGLCFIWIAVGVSVYYFYGMPHSVLGHLEDMEGLRLVPIDESDAGHQPLYSSTTAARLGEKESLLAPLSGDRVITA